MSTGRQGIITFPDMAYWKGRLQPGIRGIMPVTSSLPNHWFDTPNIHLRTVNGFEALCKLKNINILERTVVDHTHSNSTLPMRLFPDLSGEFGIYRLCRNCV
jgi:methionine biosynthesis protein MetW